MTIRLKNVDLVINGGLEASSVLVWNRPERAERAERKGACKLKVKNHRGFERWDGK